MVALLTVVTLFLCGGPVFASEATEPDGFTIEGVPNKHQLSSAKKDGYFYLYEKPDANTNKNGVIDYSGDIKNSKYLKNQLTSLVSWTSKTYTLNPNEVRTISIPFKMPDHEYNGVIAGGINVYEDDDNNQGNQPQLSMKNKYGYTIGLVLTNHDQKDAEKNVSIQLDAIKPKLDYGRKVVEADIANPNPYIFNTDSVSGSITSLKDNKVIVKNKIDHVRIAPQQVFPFQFDFKKQNMEPGEYLMKIDVKTQEKTWHFERKFEIKGGTAKDLNKKSVFKVYIPKWLNYLIIIVLVLSILLTIYLIVRKVRRNGEKTQED